MGSVHPIHKTNLNEFFDIVFGEQSGYTYSPTKNPVTGVFEQYFFKWPQEKEELIDHVRRYSPTHEVYYAPSLYSSPKADKESFLGSQYIWVEFDGKLPDTNEIPSPSIKIQSSEENYQHWYWRLTNFVTDKEILEDLTHRLTYYLQGDLGCWNSNRVLRPPGTVHHESGRQVELLRFDIRPVDILSFAQVPEVPIKILNEADIGHIPHAADVIAKYPFKKEDFDFFKVPKIITVDGKRADRSAALAKVGHICMEMGMSNAETLSLLQHADDRWGKYKDRPDRKNRLLGIINYCRAKHPVDPIKKEVESPLKVFTYEEFIKTKVEIEWVIKDFIHRKGLIVTFGPAGVGKSQLLLRFGQCLATGSQFLKWSIPKPMKLLFVSMEMFHEELLHFLRTMKMGENLNGNLLVMPLGSSIRLHTKIAKEHLNRVIEEYQPDGVVLDSYGKAISEDLSSEKVIFEVLDYVNHKIRGEYGCFTWFIHHPRKGQIGNKRPNKLDDMYGSTYLGNESTNVFTMWDNGPLIDLKCLKLRLAPEFESFKIQRTPDLNFKVVEGTRIKTDEPLFGPKFMESF